MSYVVCIHTQSHDSMYDNPARGIIEILNLVYIYIKDLQQETCLLIN